MISTRLEELQSPAIISENSIQANLQRLNKIKAELLNFGEEGKKSFGDIVDREIQVESNIKDILNPLQSFYNASVALSKKEMELKSELDDFCKFYTENMKSIAGKQFSDYTIKVKALKTNFDAVKSLKEELDTAYQSIKPNLKQLDELNTFLENNNQLFDLLNKELELSKVISNLDTSIKNRYENINNLQTGIEQRNLQIDELETSVARRKKKVRGLEAGIEGRNEYIKDLEASIDKRYERIGQRIEFGFDESKQHPSIPVSPMLQEQMQIKPQSVSVTKENKKETVHTKKHSISSSTKTIEKKKKASQSTTQQTNSSPKTISMSLVNESKAYNDDRSSLSHTYKAAVDAYSGLASDFSLYAERVKMINNTYEINNEKRKALIMEARRQHALHQQPSTTPTQATQSHEHSQSKNVTIMVKAS